MGKENNSLFTTNETQKKPPQDVTTPFHQKTLDGDVSMENENEKIDLFNVNECLLSLDWEINTENIEQFQNAIDNLTQNPAVDNDSQIMLEAILMILKYLKEAMFDASPLSIQTLHKAVDCLKTLQDDKSLSDEERNNIKTDFLNQFDKLDFSEEETEKQRVVSSKKAPKPRKETRQSTTSSPGPKAAKKTKDGPSSVEQLLKKSHDHIKAMEKTILYFDSIKAYMEDNMNRAESISRLLIETTEKLHVALAVQEKKLVRDSSYKKDNEKSPPAPKKEDTTINTASAKDSVAAPISIYLVRVKGVTIGIPSNAVVSSFKITKRQALYIKQQGYATLPNFQKPFKKFKTDIKGPLALKTVDTLKKMKFPLAVLSPLIFGKHVSVTTPQSQGMVLLTDTVLYSMLFIDDIFNETQYPIQTFRKSRISKEVTGIATVQGSIGPVKIDVLNISKVLSKSNAKS